MVKLITINIVKELNFITILSIIIYSLPIFYLLIFSVSFLINFLQIFNIQYLLYLFDLFISFLNLNFKFINQLYFYDFAIDTNIENKIIFIDTNSIKTYNSDIADTDIKVENSKLDGNLEKNMTNQINNNTIDFNNKSESINNNIIISDNKSDKFPLKWFRGQTKAGVSFVYRGPDFPKEALNAKDIGELFKLVQGKPFMAVFDNGLIPGNNSSVPDHVNSLLESPADVHVYEGTGRVHSFKDFGNNTVNNKIEEVNVAVVPIPFEKFAPEGFGQSIGKDHIRDHTGYIANKNYLNTLNMVESKQK